MFPAANWNNWYGSWTLGELVDAYEILRSTSVCNGDTYEISMGLEEDEQ